MAKFNLKMVGDELLRNIKMASYFPFKTGNLKYHATSGVLLNENTYRIKFDSTVAPYVGCLEEGTDPHNIPHAFGKPLPFGTSGRFDGKFHPGSMKHKGFIKDKTVRYIINSIVSLYNGKVEIR